MRDTSLRDFVGNQILAEIQRNPAVTADQVKRDLMAYLNSPARKEIYKYKKDEESVMIQWLVNFVDSFFPPNGKGGVAKANNTRPTASNKTPAKSNAQRPVSGTNGQRRSQPRTQPNAVSNANQTRITAGSFSPLALTKASSKPTKPPSVPKAATTSKTLNSMNRELAGIVQNQGQTPRPNAPMGTALESFSAFDSPAGPTTGAAPIQQPPLGGGGRTNAPGGGQKATARTTKSRTRQDDVKKDARGGLASKGRKDRAAAGRRVAKTKREGLVMQKRTKAPRTFNNL
eukprot:5868584-Pleurochrysis_carterae.AAC.2